MKKAGIKSAAYWRITVLLAALSCAIGVRAQAAGPQPIPTPVAVAVDHLRNLEYAPAKQQLRVWIAEHPDDLYAWNYLGITILYDEMFHRGVLESKVYGEGGEAFKPSKVPVTPEFQKELFSVLDKAQAVAEERLKKNPADKESLYWAGVTHGTRATYHFTLRKEYKPALHEATDAYNCHRDLLKLDPNWVDAYLVVGMNNYVVGSLPWYIKVLAALTGRHGDRDEGLRQVKRVTKEGHYAREDARLMLAVLYQREKMYAQALPLYQEMERAHPRNWLLQQEVAALFGLTNNWRMAAETYDSMLAHHDSHQPGYENLPLARILYLAGQAHERAQQYDRALAFYSEGALLKGEDRNIYRSELAAADLDVRLARGDEARRRYQHVANAVPNTEEGKLAQRALKKLPATQ